MWKTTLLLLLLCWYSPCAAWGPTGHRVIGQIAEGHLSAKARKEVSALLGHQSIAMASTWMDEVRSDTLFDHTHDHHWVTIPDGMRYADTEKNPNGDLIEAIERMKGTLRDPRATVEDKQQSLKFLIHLIGDLHQPLHVGGGDDRGGNEVKVRWMRGNSDLHRVWDSGIIDLQELSYTELAASLPPPSTIQLAQWRSGTIADWAHEAMTYRPQIYRLENDGDMGYRYAYWNWPLVRGQLLKGGVRLAAVLNEIFK